MTDEPTANAPPSAEKVAEAREVLAKLDEDERKAIAQAIAPPAPGEGGRTLNREQAVELLRENPERFHAILDAQVAGGPKVFDLGDLGVK